MYVKNILVSLSKWGSSKKVSGNVESNVFIPDDDCNEESRDENLCSEIINV